MAMTSVLLFVCLATPNQSHPSTHSGLDLQSLDRSVVVTQPSDLTLLANGNWLKSATIPPDKVGIGTFDTMFERNRMILKGIVESAARNRTASPDTSEGRVGTFCRTALNQARANKLGIEPIANELHEISAIKDRHDLLRVMGDLHSKGIGVGFLASPQQDDLNENRMLATLVQGGQLLPDRESYWSPQGAPMRRAYLATASKLLRASGMGGDADAGALLSLRLETKLARNSNTPVELRDVPGNYHVMTRDQLQLITPNLDWVQYFQSTGIRVPTEFDVSQPKFFKGFDALVKGESLSSWRCYLKTCLLNSTAPYLSDSIAEDQFQLVKAISGQVKREERWKRVINSTDSSIGEALGPLFVKEAFSLQARQNVRQLVDNLLLALKGRIEGLDWMSATTKHKALDKLAKFIVKVGYPDRWRDYSKLHLREDSWAQNVKRAARFEWKRQWNKIGRPIDRTEWGMTVTQINAYYNQFNNEIVFPAGVLQPGFFDPKADDAVNYGAIGMAIGHEITHGFDDQGALYDGNGRRSNWWTDLDKKNFDAASQTVVQQYGNLKTMFGQPINGQLTLGENIADTGGQTIALQAYLHSLHGKPAPVLEGFTGVQRFFLSSAQGFRGKYRKEFGDIMVATDPHTPPDLRCYVPSGDQPEFYKAFGLPVPAQLPHVW